MTTAETQVPTVLIVGPDFFGYNQSIAQAFERRGFATCAIDSPTHTPKGFWNRLSIDLAGKFGVHRYAKRWRSSFNARILQTAAELRPDLLLIIKGDWVDPATFEQIPARRKAIWFQDKVSRCGPHSLDHAKIADAAFVFEGTDIETLQSEGCASPIFLPMAFDPEIYRNEGRAEKDIDVCFVGRMYDNRKELVDHMVAVFPAANIQIWGRYVRYREPLTWLLWLRRMVNRRWRRVYRNRNIPPKAVNALYNRSKIVLNVHHGQSRNGCNPRTFEIMATGALQICDANPFIRDEVSPDIPQFQTITELEALLARYLQDDTARRDAAAKSEAAAGNHTFDARVHAIIERLG